MRTGILQLATLAALAIAGCTAEPDASPTSLEVLKSAYRLHLDNVTLDSKQDERGNVTVAFRLIATSSEDVEIHSLGVVLFAGEDRYNASTMIAPAEAVTHVPGYTVRNVTISLAPPKDVPPVVFVSISYWSPDGNRLQRLTYIDYCYQAQSANFAQALDGDCSLHEPINDPARLAKRSIGFHPFPRLAGYRYPPFQDTAFWRMHCPHC